MATDEPLSLTARLSVLRAERQYLHGRAVQGKVPSAMEFGASLDKAIDLAADAMFELAKMQGRLAYHQELEEAH